MNRKGGIYANRAYVTRVRLNNIVAELYFEYLVYMLPIHTAKRRRLTPTENNHNHNNSYEVTSNHAITINPGEVYDVPLSVLIRPFQHEVDESKVDELVQELSTPEGLQAIPPIDILWVVGTEGGNYFYSFGGCHRYNAHKKLELPTIKGKIIQSTADNLKYFLGASTPHLK